MFSSATTVILTNWIPVSLLKKIPNDIVLVIRYFTGWYLSQSGWIIHIFMNKQTAPALLHVIKMLSVKRYTRTDKLHILFPDTNCGLAGAIWTAGLFFNLSLLLQQEVHHVFVGIKFIAHHIHNFCMPRAQCFFALLYVHFI